MKKIVFVAVLVLMLIPFPSLVAPDWTVTVVDENHKPLKGVLVRESYKNYSFESEGHEVDAHSDQLGHASFALKKLHPPLLMRMFGMARSATGGVHASFGPYDYVLAFADDGAQGSSETWTGSPSHVQSVIVLKR